MKIKPLTTAISCELPSTKGWRSSQPLPSLYGALSLRVTGANGGGGGLRGANTVDGAWLYNGAEIALGTKHNLDRCMCMALCTLFHIPSNLWLLAAAILGGGGGGGLGGLEVTPGVKKLTSLAQVPGPPSTGEKVPHAFMLYTQALIMLSSQYQSWYSYQPKRIEKGYRIRRLCTLLI